MTDRVYTLGQMVRKTRLDRGQTVHRNLFKDETVSIFFETRLRKWNTDFSGWTFTQGGKHLMGTRHGFNFGMIHMGEIFQEGGDRLLKRQNISHDAQTHSRRLQHWWKMAAVFQYKKDKNTLLCERKASKSFTTPSGCSDRRCTKAGMVARWFNKLSPDWIEPSSIVSSR